MISDTKILLARDAFDINVDLSSGLTLRVQGGVLLDGLGFKLVPNAELTLTASTTNYVEVDDVGTISVNTTGFTDGRTNLYIVTTNATVVTGIADWRFNPDVDQQLAATEGVPVINKSGTAIAAGKLVALNGLDTTSGKPKIVLADADAALPAFGVTTAEIANDAAGTVHRRALSAADINTNSASTAGDPVYLDTTAGGFAHTAPSGATARVQIVGYVVVKSATVGQIKWILDQPHIVSGTNQLQDAAVTLAKVAPATLDGTVAKVQAAANVIGAIPVLHRIDLSAGALAETDVVLTHKTRIIDAWVVLTGAGVATTTLKVQNGATTITNAMDVSGSDKAVVRCTTIDDAQHEIAAAGTLRIKTETGATQPACTVYVLGVRVA